MSRIDINHIKKYYPIIDLAKRLGIDVHNNMCKCPFHKEGQENNPSMSFHKASNTFKCFACDTRGSNIDLVMKYLNYDFKGACYYIIGHSPCNDVKSLVKGKQTSNRACIKPTSSLQTQYITKSTQNTAYSNTVDTNYHDIYDFMLNHTEYTCSGDSYLKSRGITINSIACLNIKTIIDAPLLTNELKNKFSMDILKESGLFNEFEKFVYKSDYLLIPYFYKDSRIITIKARDTKKKIYKNLKGRPLYLYGINHIYNGVTLRVEGIPTHIGAKDIKNVYISEGEIDALSMLECGLIAVSVSGVNNWKDIYTRELLNYNVVFAGDNDKAGEAMYNRLVESFRLYGRPIKRVALHAYKGSKDINELLNK